LATELTRTVDELLALVAANGHDPAAEIEDRRANELATRCGPS